MDCIFCKIISDEIKTNKVYEDEETLAFLDAHPVHTGHTLVVPKDHFENIYTVPQELWARMNLTAQKIALAVKEATNADGINVCINNEKAAGQIIFHSHIHIIPRKENDGLKLFPSGSYNGEDPEEIAEKIKSFI